MDREAKYMIIRSSTRSVAESMINNKSLFDFLFD